MSTFSFPKLFTLVAGFLSSLAIVLFGISTIRLGTIVEDMVKRQQTLSDRVVALEQYTGLEGGASIELGEGSFEVVVPEMAPALEIQRGSVVYSADPLTR